MPMYFNKKLVSQIIFEPVGDSEVFRSEIQTFMSDFILKRQNVQSIQDNHDSLLSRL